MVAAGFWKREDIDSIKAQLFSVLKGLSNIIINKVIMKVTWIMRDLWDIVEQLA